jgi:hypothetical protein
LALSLVVAALGVGSARAQSVETIVLVRHAEKPAAGLGQLSCQGLNRALALPGVLLRMFGRPEAIFAPDPSVQKRDGGVAYDYVRPLATIEPTAIAAALPVDASLGVSRIGDLQSRLEAPGLHGAVVLVAWEHHGIEALARALMAAHGGAAAAVPAWRGDDFDGVFVVRLRWQGDRAAAQFVRRTEGLDGQPAACGAGAAGFAH